MDSYEYQFNPNTFKNDSDNDVEEGQNEEVETLNNLSPGKSVYPLLFRIFITLLFIAFIVLSVLMFIYYGDDNSNIKYIKHTVVNTLTNKNHISSKNDWYDYTHFRNKNLETRFYDEPMVKHNLNIVFNDINFHGSLTYLIKNVLFKFNGKCMITVISNKDNYDEIKNTCDKISENINVVEIENSAIYNKELINNIHGIHLLFHNMHSLLLKSDLSDYTKYDYVGVDGFCLVNKNKLLNILRKEKITTHNDLVNKFVNKPDKELSENFIIDNVWNRESVGCHNFWINEAYVEDFN